jgi:hypothetical protein
MELIGLVGGNIKCEILVLLDINGGSAVSELAINYVEMNDALLYCAVSTIRWLGNIMPE